jgi:hypothetical protein
MKLKRKIKSVHELVGSVLNPKISIFGKKKETSQDNYWKIIINDEIDSETFYKCMNTLLNQETVRNFTNFFNFELKSFNSKPILSAPNLNFQLILRYYRSVLSYNKTKIINFLQARADFEKHLTIGNFEKAGVTIQNIEETYGESIWLVRAKFILLANSEKLDELAELYENLKKISNDPLYLDLLQTYFWIYQSTDASLTIENMVKSRVIEFKEGGAIEFSSLYSLLFLPFPHYNENNLINSVYQIQSFNVIDAYILAEKACKQSLANEKHENTEMMGDFADFVNNSFINPKVTLVENEISFSTKITEPEPPGHSIEYKMYISGKFKQLISDFEENWANSKKFIESINMYAKSYIQCQSSPSNRLPAFSRNLLKLFINIYELRDTTQSISQIISLIIKTEHLELSTKLCAALSLAVPNYLTGKQKEQLLHFNQLTCRTLSPAMLVSGTDQRAFISEEMSKSDMPSQRIKFEILDALKKSNISNQHLIERMDDYKKSSIIYKDYVELKCYALEKLNKNDDLLNFAAESLVYSPDVFISLPTEFIKKHIESNQISSLEAVIFAHFHDKGNNGSTGNSFINETFEEFIYSNGEKRPSELLSELEELNEKEIFFYSEVANESTMNYLGIFDGTKDLYIERLRLLSTLIEKGVVTHDSVIDEYRTTIDAIVINESTAKITNSKIGINTKLIFERRSEEVKTLLSLFEENNHEDGNFDKEDCVLLSESPDSNSDIKLTAIAKGTKNAVVQRIVDLLITDFIDELDKSLSSEIRHGFFSNLMRAGLEDRHLIADFDENGVYIPSPYWKELYSFVNKEILNGIDESIISFSKDFNELIEVAENWMKVTTSYNDTDRQFKVILLSDDFIRIKSVLESGSTPEGVSNYIFDLLLRKVEKCFKSIKIKLNEDLANRLDDLFNLFRLNIEESKRGTSLNELCSAIELNQNKIKEDISAVCDWFGLKKDEKHAPVPLSHVVKIAENCFRQTSSTNCQIKIVNESSNLVDGDLVSPIVLSLINCFNNAVKYGLDNEILVCIKSNGYSFSITISNKVSSDDYIRLKAEGLNRIKSKLSNKNSIELLRKEGGTGLYKSQHYLQLASPRLSLVPEMSKNGFTIGIRYDC